MPVDVRLLFKTEYPEVGGEDPDGVAGYFIAGASSYSDAFANLNAAAPDVDAATGLYKKRIRIEEPGPGVFVGYVTYGIKDFLLSQADPAPGSPPAPPPPPAPGEDDPLGGEFSFTTTGGTEHRTQSIFTPAVVKLAADPAPPATNRAIGLARDGTVAGVDVVAPKLEFSLGVRLPYFTLKYVKKLRDLTGKTNAATWWTFTEQEVLFMGADGRTSRSDGASLNLHFATGKTRRSTDPDPNMAVAPGLDFATVRDRIYPFEHVWVMYRDGVSNGVPTQVPFAAFIEQVYPNADFAALGVG